MKSEYIEALWDRAVKTLYDATMTLSFSPDAAANRAYYAAFFAVSALFAVEDRFFKKHSAIRAAVHKDLVHAGHWPSSLGADYNKLYKLREVADYGVLKHAEHDEAAGAVAAAERILRAVHESNPSLFPLTGKGRE